MLRRFRYIVSIIFVPWGKNTLQVTYIIKWDIRVCKEDKTFCKYRHGVNMTKFMIMFTSFLSIYTITTYSINHNVLYLSHSTLLIKNVHYSWDTHKKWLKVKVKVLVFKSWFKLTLLLLLYNYLADLWKLPHSYIFELSILPTRTLQGHIFL